MTEVTRNLADRPPAAETGLRGAAARARQVAFLTVIVLAALGWAYLALLTAGSYDPLSAFDAICRAMADTSPGISGAALIALMWGAMTLAMMVPTAAPMILTYAEMAEGERTASPFVLTAGYTAVWLAFAAVATLAQIVLIQFTLLDTGMRSASGLFSGTILLAAGLYQFSAFKYACLTRCRLPTPLFQTNWAASRQGVFRLGVQQGLQCLGCCWAMMAVMFALGVMNVLWMAALGIVMTIEKMTTGRLFTYTVGVVLIAAGLGFIVTSFAAHWPAQLG